MDVLGIWDRGFCVKRGEQGWVSECVERLDGEKGGIPRVGCQIYRVYRYRG